MTDLVAVERAAEDARVAIITLKGPGLNALGESMLHALSQAIEQIGNQPPRCVILTSADERAFSAGADIAAMSPMTRPQALAYAQLGQGTFAALEALPCPVIAAVSGFALGGGCELALACDFIYAADKIKIGQPEVKLGVLPGFGGTQRLARRVGVGLARELIYTGRQLGAEEALRIGLVNAVCPRAELPARALACAREIANNGPSAIRASKRVINAGFDAPLLDGLGLEARAFGQCFEGAEQQEGMGAFLAKRPAAFPDPEVD
jgi:enoyl-CoA hydratase